ncbi:MAG: hypothetical protein V3V14_03030 [Saprospiraceae bacterium]
MHRLIILTLFIFSLSTMQVYSQNALAKKQKIEALNSTLNFINEGCHGMLIVHRMLENYNQDINKYVDLESYKINFYSNKDLPKDIFDDPENWFYDTSPYEWFDIASKQSEKAKYINFQGVVGDIGRMKTFLYKINQLRFDVDALIINKDLTDTTALNKVYQKLEEGVILFESYFELHQNVLKKVNTAFQPLIPNANDLQYPKVYKKMEDLYISTRDIMLSIRKKENEQLQNQISAQQKALGSFQSMNMENVGSTRMSGKKMSRYTTNIGEQGNLSLRSIKNFYETADVPTEYRQYGKFYYYYNSDLINKFNRYGNGIVFEMNNIVKYLDLPVLLFTELPHYYKVVYPKKLEKVDHLVATDSKITILPTKLKDREIQMSTRKIKVDSLVFEVTLYDHMIEDGDVVSLNFNGDWIVEKMLLTAKHFPLKLQLNEQGKNFFILHAENVGRRPPNTMAVDYYYHGRKKQIILKSNLNVSEMIEIEYIK